MSVTIERHLDGAVTQAALHRFGVCPGLNSECGCTVTKFMEAKFGKSGLLSSWFPNAASEIGFTNRPTFDGRENKFLAGSMFELVVKFRN